MCLGRWGFSLRSLALHSSAAYIASLCGSDDVISTPHLENAITHHNTCVPLSDSLSISILDGRTPKQKKLPNAIEEMQFNSLLNICSLAEKARLLSVSSPHASAWISVVPFLSLGLHLDPNEFQTAVKWWLSVNPSLNLNGNPMVCPLCPDFAVDPLGYHCVTCRRGVDVRIRHNTQDSQCGLQHLPVSWSVCTSRSWLWMGTRQFQDKTSRHPCYQLGLWNSAGL